MLPKLCNLHLSFFNLCCEFGFYFKIKSHFYIMCYNIMQYFNKYLTTIFCHVLPIGTYVRPIKKINSTLLLSAYIGMTVVNIQLEISLFYIL